MENSIKGVLSNYFDNLSAIQMETIHNGLINKTYKINIDGFDFILQNINQKVFPNVEALLNNKIKVAEFLFANGFRTLEFISNNKGQLYTAHENEIWQLTKYIPSVVYHRVETVAMANKAGQYLAKFHGALLDFPLTQLAYTIPDFHNTSKRFYDVLQSVNDASIDRLKNAEVEIEFLKNYLVKIEPVINKINEGLIPLRVVHNDTKISNMLFDESGEVICLIDLDTLMPGSILHDVGDALRTASNTSTEDEVDLERVSFDKAIYTAYLSAYILTARKFLSELELQSLHMALPILLFEQACRFLTDYLNHDQYYITSFADQNLSRTKTQIKLLRQVSEYLNNLDSNKFDC